MKRIIYFVYYLKETDWKKFKNFILFAKNETGRSLLSIIVDCIISTFIYNVSLLDYFYFRFYKLSKSVRDTYAGTGFMYEYQLKMNPKKHRDILINKDAFLKKFSQFVQHRYSSLLELKSNHTDNYFSSPKLVLKSSTGQCGKGIVMVESKKYNLESLITKMEETNNDMVEEFVVQHRQLMKLSPSGLNTVRVITQLTSNNDVIIIGTRLRITVNSSVDNLAAGNIAASIDQKTGIVTGPAVYSDITKNEEITHPVTGVKIIGFKIPYWKETIKMVCDAARMIPENRSIGWDVAITDNGPELIEGNHDWCKLLWQLPVKKGLKHKLVKYLKT